MKRGFTIAFLISIASLLLFSSPVLGVCEEDGTVELDPTEGDANEEKEEEMAGSCEEDTTIEEEAIVVSAEELVEILDLLEPDAEPLFDIEDVPAEEEEIAEAVAEEDEEEPVPEEVVEPGMESETWDEPEPEPPGEIVLEPELDQAPGDAVPEPESEAPDEEEEMADERDPPLAAEEPHQPATIQTVIGDESADATCFVSTLF